MHGSPLDRDEYLLKPPQWQRALREMKNTYFGLDICFFGHTHYPMVIGKEIQEVSLKEDKTVQLKRGKIVLVNPGSVGQPRDGCPKACFATFDDASYELSYHRLDYDVEAAQKAVLDAGLSRRFADRLAAGR